MCFFVFFFHDIEQMLLPPLLAPLFAFVGEASCRPVFELFRNSMFTLSSNLFFIYGRPSTPFSQCVNAF